MIEKKLFPKTLSVYVDTLQKQGIFIFNMNEAASILGINLFAARQSAHRLSQKKRIFRVYRNFYVIVPLEYQEIGSPPPELFINSLMRYMNTDYYVGLLSAAILYGVTPQQPMLFQVITLKYSRLIKTPNTDIRLYRNNHIYKTGIEQKKTVAGYMNISTPELTAFDLVRYARVFGYYSQISGILSELSKRIRGKRLFTLARNICQEHGDWIYWQRLGYLLDTVGFQHIADPLATLINDYQPGFGYLLSGKTENVLEKSSRWHLYINDTIKKDC